MPSRKFNAERFYVLIKKLTLITSLLALLCSIILLCVYGYYQLKFRALQSDILIDGMSSANASQFCSSYKNESASLLKKIKREKSAEELEKLRPLESKSLFSLPGEYYSVEYIQFEKSFEVRVQYPQEYHSLYYYCMVLSDFGNNAKDALILALMLIAGALSIQIIFWCGLLIKRGIVRLYEYLFPLE